MTHHYVITGTGDADAVKLTICVLAEDANGKTQKAKASYQIHPALLYGLLEDYEVGEGSVS